MARKQHHTYDQNDGFLDEDDGRVSRSQKKRDATALQDMGARLVELPDRVAVSLDLPPDLLQAIREARKITSHGAKKRQLQFIGRLMRDVDADAVRAALEDVDAVTDARAELFQELEALRDRLIADEDAAFAEVGSRFAAAECGQLDEIRRLAREAAVERAKGTPPHAFRALFRLLRRLQEGTAGCGGDDGSMDVS